MTTQRSAATSDRTETDATSAQVEIGDLVVVAPAPPRPLFALPGTVRRPLTVRSEPTVGARSRSLRTAPGSLGVNLMSRVGGRRRPVERPIGACTPRCGLCPLTARPGNLFTGVLLPSGGGTVVAAGSDLERVAGRLVPDRPVGARPPTASRSGAAISQWAPLP